MEKFKQLGLSPELLHALEDLGIKEPRNIQELTIPVALAGKDVIGGSATGSGKTLSFGAPMLDRLVSNGRVQALVMVPTRELAEQVCDSLMSFAKYKQLKFATVYGGVSIEPQIRAIQRADIIVGTPGRILDHLDRRTLDLSHIKILVLDEADRMVDMGFIRDVENIIKLCPKDRQTLLFSATLSGDIDYIAHKYMRNPESLAVESYVDPSKLKQVYYDVLPTMKFSLLAHLLKHEHPGLIMVFCNTQRNTDMIAEQLERQGIDAIPIHGGLTQNKRSRVMERFKSNKISVLVCTDVAARGLDISGVSHVYNYDLPNNSKEYVHRIGRTARAGKDGIAINIVSQRDYDNLRQILRNPDLHLEQLKLPEFEKVAVQFRESSGRRFGNRGGDRRGGFGGRSGGRSFGGNRFGNRGGDRRGFGRREDSNDGERRSFSPGRGRSGVRNRMRGNRGRDSDSGFRGRRY